MKISITVIAAIFCFSAFAQTNSSIPGIWKGTSICQVKNSPCHDEIAVYHVSKGDSLNSFKILMNKIVNNQEEEMGTLDFKYDSDKKTLTSKDKDRDALWVFKLEGKRIKGTLVYNKNLYRIIDVIKED